MLASVVASVGPSPNAPNSTSSPDRGPGPGLCRQSLKSKASSSPERRSARRVPWRGAEQGVGKELGGIPVSAESGRWDWGAKGKRHCTIFKNFSRVCALARILFAACKVPKDESPKALSHSFSP